MSRFFWIASIVLSPLVIGVAQRPLQFVGRLEPELVTGPIRPGLPMTAVSEETRQTLGSAIAEGDTVFAGTLRFFGDGKRPIYLVVSR